MRPRSGDALRQVVVPNPQQVGDEPDRNQHPEQATGEESPEYADHTQTDREVNTDEVHVPQGVDGKGVQCGDEERPEEQQHGRRRERYDE